MSTVMIVGASRGIGLSLQTVREAGDQVIACARDTGEAKKLDSLAEGSKNIVIKGLGICMTLNPLTMQSGKSAIAMIN